jgi:hypothetical protein
LNHFYGNNEYSERILLTHKLSGIDKEQSVKNAAYNLRPAKQYSNSDKNSKKQARAEPGIFPVLGCQADIYKLFFKINY